MSSTNEKVEWKREIPVVWNYTPPVVDDSNAWNKTQLQFGKGEGGLKCQPIRFGTGWDDYKFAGWICHCTNEHTFIDGRDRPKM